MVQELEALKKVLLDEQQDLLDEFSEMSNISSSQWKELQAKLTEFDGRLENPVDQKDEEFKSLQEDLSSALREMQVLASEMRGLQTEQTSASGMQAGELPEEFEENLRSKISESIKKLYEEHGKEEGVDSSSFIDALSEPINELIRDIQMITYPMRMESSVPAADVDRIEASILRIENGFSILNNRLDLLSDKVEMTKESVLEERLPTTGPGTTEVNDDVQAEGDDPKDSGASGVPIRSWLSNNQELEPNVESKRSDEMVFSGGGGEIVQNSKLRGLNPLQRKMHWRGL